MLRVIFFTRNSCFINTLDVDSSAVFHPSAGRYFPYDS